MLCSTFLFKRKADLGSYSVFTYQTCYCPDPSCCKSLLCSGHRIGCTEWLGGLCHLPDNLDISDRKKKLFISSLLFHVCLVSISEQLKKPAGSFPRLVSFCFSLQIIRIGGKRLAEGDTYMYVFFNMITRNVGTSFVCFICLRTWIQLDVQNSILVYYLSLPPSHFPPPISTSQCPPTPTAHGQRSRGIVNQDRCQVHPDLNFCPFSEVASWLKHTPRWSFLA